ncbi:hypothetical protein TorRG33x02_210680 [Trema orientale]|uniref:Uncharacterized protein n=1 Tax=Trema orientale TaxID=63057 RepID=A0A2P5EC55_TREOI|nr:hypothetical protein TorRG33x02_210680 [Trema orientale]
MASHLIKLKKLANEDYLDLLVNCYRGSFSEKIGREIMALKKSWVEKAQQQVNENKFKDVNTLGLKFSLTLAGFLLLTLKDRSDEEIEDTIHMVKCLLQSLRLREDSLVIRRCLAAVDCAVTCLESLRKAGQTKGTSLSLRRGKTGRYLFITLQEALKLEVVSTFPCTNPDVLQAKTLKAADGCVTLQILQAKLQKKFKELTKDLTKGGPGIDKSLHSMKKEMKIIWS